MPQYHRLVNEGSSIITIISAGNVNTVNSGEVFEGIIDRIDMRARDECKFTVIPIAARNIRMNELNRAALSNELLVSFSSQPTNEDMEELRTILSEWKPGGRKA